MTTKADIKHLGDTFRAELDRCNCHKCRLIVGAIFAIWSEPETVAKLMDAYRLHCDICYWHRYQAHQDG